MWMDPSCSFHSMWDLYCSQIIPNHRFEASLFFDGNGEPLETPQKLRKVQIHSLSRLNNGSGSVEQIKNFRNQLHFSEETNQQYFTICFTAGWSWRILKRGRVCSIGTTRINWSSTPVWCFVITSFCNLSKVVRFDEMERLLRRLAAPT